MNIIICKHSDSPNRVTTKSSRPVRAVKQNISWLLYIFRGVKTNFAASEICEENNIFSIRTAISFKFWTTRFVTGAPSWNQVVPQGQRKRCVCEAHPGADQAANPARAQAAVRHPQGLHCVMSATRVLRNITMWCQDNLAPVSEGNRFSSKKKCFFRMELVVA
jgi:hypothetical protein